MKIIGVYTKDFSLSHDIIDRLKQRGLKYIHLHSLDRIPSRVGVIITSSLEGKGLKKRRVVYADCHRDIDSALDLAVEMLSGESEEIVLGVDPGEYPGIALLSGNSILRTWCASSVDDALQIIKGVLRDFSYKKRKIIRIGHDAKIYRDRLIEKLSKEKVEIEIVDEKGTTQKTGIHRKKRNELAAIKIAKLKGKPLYSNGNKRYTNGEIKEIQKKSRIMSGGKLTISRELAVKVLDGEISLEDAINISRCSKNL